MAYYITAHAMMRYFMLAEMSGEKEVGGYAKFHLDEHENVIITELKPIKQQSNPVHFEISAADNALFLEGIVSEGEDPKDWGMLFHTHPEGVDARMSGVDEKMLEEMATDAPGTVARSMILEQGTMTPMIHEAVCIEGRVFVRESYYIKILDTTDAHNDLKAIGFFDQPKVVKPKTVIGKSVAKRDEDWVPQHQSDSDDEWDEWDEHWDAWLNEKEAAENPSCRWTPDDFDIDAEAVSYIGSEVIHNGVTVPVIDAYVWDSEIILCLANNIEVPATEVAFVDKSKESANGY